MLIQFTERLCDSPCVSRVWHAHSRHEGPFLSVAYPQWEVVVSRVNDSVSLTLRGPETFASRAWVPAEGSWVGVRFKNGAMMPSLRYRLLVDAALSLPAADNHSFWLDGEKWEIPSFENAEAFVARLVRAGLLVWDPFITGSLRGEGLRKDNARAVQRRFSKSTGLSRKAILTIERAHSAAIMLRGGATISDTVAALGYSDQPHLTRSLKRLIGLTPARLASKQKPVQLSFMAKPEPLA